MEKRKIRKKLRSLLSLIMSAVLLASMMPESVFAGGYGQKTVLQAVQEADSGCDVAPPTITSFQSSDEKNASGNWTFSGTFTAVAGAEVYELHLGTMEGNGNIYERGLYTLNKTATSFSVSPNWYDYTAVAGDTVYAALEAIIKTGSGNNEKWVSTGWQSLKETTVGPAPEEGKNKLTVRFINQNQMSVASPHIEFLDQGDSYSVDVPEIDGYDCQYASDKVTGTMGDKDIEIKVSYIGKKVDLSITYLYNSDRTQAFDPVNAEYKVGDSYSYPSPELANYKADPETVEGYVTAEDVPQIEREVLYRKDKYILETRYVLWDGDNNPENDEEIRERETQYVEAGTTYSVAHMRIDPYMRADDQGHVILDTQENENLKKEGVMPEARLVVRLYYMIEKSNLTISFVRDDDNSQVAVGFTGEWRRDQDFTWEAPVDQVKGYQLIDSEGFFDGKNITIPKYYFQDATGGYGNAVNYTKTFKYYKKLKDTIHFKYGNPDGTEEFIEDSVYSHYSNAGSTGYYNYYFDTKEMPRKDGYLASRAYVTNNGANFDPDELKKDTDSTIYYSPYTIEDARIVSAAAPIKVYLNDKYRDPLEPSAAYDLQFTALWQWCIDRDSKNYYSKSGNSGEVEVYVNGKYVTKTSRWAEDYPATGNYSAPRGATFTINTALLPTGGSFKLTTYEKRNNWHTGETVYVKTEFDVNAAEYLGSNLLIISPENVKETYGNDYQGDGSGSDTVTYTWTMPADPHYTYLQSYVAGGAKGIEEYRVHGGSGGIVINQDGSASYTVTLSDTSAMEEEACTMYFYGRANYQEYEGSPVENRWVYLFRNETLGGAYGIEEYKEWDDDALQYVVKTRKAKFSTTTTAAWKTEFDHISYGTPVYHMKWNYSGGILTEKYKQGDEGDESTETIQSAMGYVLSQQNNRSEATLVDLDTNRCIGTAYHVQSSLDEFCQAYAVVDPGAMLEHYLLTGNTTLHFGLYLQLRGACTKTGDGHTCSPQKSLTVNDGEPNYHMAPYNEIVIVTGSCSFSHDEVSGSIWADTNSSIEDRRLDPATGWSSIDAGGNAKIFINSTANWEGDGGTNAGILRYDIYANEYGEASADTWAGQGVNGIRYQDGHGKYYYVEREDANTLSISDTLYDGSGSTGAYGSTNTRYFTPGGTANVLVKLQGYYTSGETVHIMTGDIRADVPISGTVPDTVTNFKVTKQKVALVEETNKDPRITLELEWNHKLNISASEEAAGELAQNAEIVSEDAMMAVSVGETPIADQDVRIEILPQNPAGTGSRNLLPDDTDYVESFTKTETGCKLKCKMLGYSDEGEGYRLPDGYWVYISYLKNGRVVKTFAHEIKLADQKKTIDEIGGEVIFQIDDEGNALVRVKGKNELRDGVTSVDIYDNKGQLVKEGVLTGPGVYAYTDEVKGAWLDRDSWYGKSATRWFKFNMENVTKEQRAKYYAVLHGYDWDRNTWDENIKHYATAENFVTLNRVSVNNGVFRTSYTANLHDEEFIGFDDHYDTTASWFVIGSQDGKPEYAIRKEMDCYNNNVRDFTHTETPIDNKDSTKLIYFGEEKATDLMGDEFTATVTFKDPRYLPTRYHEIKSEKVTITEQPFLSVTSATMDMSGYTTITGKYDTDMVQLKYRSLEFNIICPDGYVWTNSISYNDENFTYSDVTGTFSYKGKLADVVRGVKVMEHYNIKDFVKLKGKEIKCSVSAYASGGDIESAQIKCVFGGKLKPQVTMIETSTYNGESVLKAALPAGYMEYGVDMGEVAEQAKEAGQGLLIVTDDNYSIAFSKDVTATLDTSDAEFGIKDVTNDNQANVVKSGLTPAGAYEATISGGFTGSMEMGLPTGKLANGAKAEVYYVDNDGNKTAMSAKTVTGTNGASRSQFTTTHNSTYVVVHEGGEVTEEPTEPDTPAPVIVPIAHAINVVTGAVAKNSAGEAVNTAYENEVISISWTAKTGFGFVKWNLSGATPANETAASTTFVMGSQDVIVDFEEKLNVADEVKEELPSDTDTTTKVRSISFKNSKLTLQKDLASTANPATVTMAQGEAPEIVYVTENKDIVAVDKSGNFWPMGVGEAEVTAHCGNKTASCKVTVVSYTTAISLRDMTGAEVNEKTIEMKGGEQNCLTVSFAPYDSTDPREVSWKSDNKNVSVKAGVITAKEVTEAVTATVTATVKATYPATGKTEREITASVKVTVTPVAVAAAAAPDKGHSLNLNKNKVKLTTLDGSSTTFLDMTLSAKKDTDIAKVKILSVESTNTDVVTVGTISDPVINGKKATSSVKLFAQSAGTAYVVVKSVAADSDKVNVKRCKVTVSGPASAINVKSGTLTVTDKKITMRKGEKGTVEVVLTPEFSTDLGKVKISGKGGITVKNGIIYAKKVTKADKPATITVKCGKLKETISVTVTK